MLVGWCLGFELPLAKRLQLIGVDGVGSAKGSKGIRQKTFDIKKLKARYDIGCQVELVNEGECGIYYDSDGNVKEGECGIDYDSDGNTIYDDENAE